MIRNKYKTKTNPLPSPHSQLDFQLSELHSEISCFTVAMCFETYYFMQIRCFQSS